jgi:hypothetical protein
MIGRGRAHHVRANARRRRGRASGGRRGRDRRPRLDEGNASTGDRGDRDSGRHLPGQRSQGRVRQTADRARNDSPDRRERRRCKQAGPGPEPQTQIAPRAEEERLDGRLGHLEGGGQLRV